MIIETVVRRKENAENRNNRTASKTVNKSINSVAIGFNVGLISLASLYPYFTMRV